MKRYFAAAFAALVIGSAAVTVVHSEQAPAPTGLGFLDIKKALESYRKHSDVMEQLKKKNDLYVTQFKQREAQIERDADKLNTMNKDTPDYADLEEQITGAKSVLDVAKKFRGRELDREQRKKNTLIYKEICQEAQAYGQEKGLAAVLLFIPPETDFEQDLDLIVPTRAVLCRDDQLDVTKDVVDRLNAQLPPPQVKPKPPEPDTPENPK